MQLLLGIPYSTQMTIILDTSGGQTILDPAGTDSGWTFIRGVKQKGLWPLLTNPTNKMHRATYNKDVWGHPGRREERRLLWRASMMTVMMMMMMIMALMMTRWGPWVWWWWWIDDYNYSNSFDDENLLRLSVAGAMWRGERNVFERKLCIEKCRASWRSAGPAPRYFNSGE